MTWKEFLKEYYRKYSNCLLKDRQYKGYRKSEIRKAAWSEVYIMLEELKGWKIKDLVLKYETGVGKSDKKIMNDWLEKRKTGVPLPQVLKKWEFCGNSFLISPNVLIPRLETEEFVDYILNDFKRNTKNINLIDLGTGSGCILVSFLKKTDLVFKKIWAVDVCQKALELAEKNIKKTDSKVIVLKSDLLNFLKRKLDHNTTYLILTNLPYLSQKEYDSLPLQVKNYEPKKALVGGKYGYELILKFLNQIIDYHLRDKSNKWIMYLELSPTVVEGIKKYINKSEVPIKIEFRKDISGKTRFAKIEI